MHAFILAHPLISALIYAWFVGAGALFGPAIQRAYAQWKADRPMRERVALSLRPRRRPF